MTLLEAKQHLCRKLDITYSDIANNDLFTDDDLTEYINLAIKRVWDYKPWDFTEGSKTATTTSEMITAGYIDYPNDFQSGSVYLLRVANKEYRKLSFQDYLKFQEDTPTSTEKVWSEQNRFIFINPNSYTAGDILDLYGKFLTAPVSADGHYLPFSPNTDNNEHSGNEAVVLLAFSEALSSEKKKDLQKAEVERGKAYQLLDLLWKPFSDARSLLQTKNRPMFEINDWFGTSI